jgi:hypothetical protein
LQKFKAFYTYQPRVCFYGTKKHKNIEFCCTFKTYNGFYITTNEGYERLCENSDFIQFTPRFIDVSRLPGLVNRGELWLKVNLSFREAEKLLEPTVFDEKLYPQQMLQFCNNPKFGDFVFHFDGNQTLSAHKVILASRSEFFKRIIKDGSNDMKIDNCSTDGFKAFLEFIYSNSIAQTEKHANEVLTLADRYEMKNLKKYYEHTFYNMIHDAKAFEVFNFAHRFHLDQELKFHAYHRIQT